uniref:Uncharacterized protein n=1 Tax=Panagrolaimus superbus TaxID=310955 RepID=A0A914XVL5_9BILA
MLAKEVLYEVPAQLTSYMKSKGIYPRSATSPFLDDQSRRTSINTLESPRTPRRLLPAPPDDRYFNFNNLQIS